MSLTRVAGGRTAIALMMFAAAVSCLLAAGVLDVAFAQGAPFGAPRSAAPPPPADGIVGWIFAKQAEFYQSFSRIIRAAKTDGTAVWTLLGVSFLYGIFHAAGPGHGKAVISSYLVANEETWRRGIVLSFASALLQAFVAVAFVVIAAWVFNATMSTMCTTERWIEIVSYALIALIGLRLVWVKGRALINTVHTMTRPLHAVGAAVTPHDHQHGHDHKHDHGHHHHGHGDHHHGRHDHSHRDMKRGLAVATDGYQDPHELAHANDIRRQFADRNVTTWQIVVFGLTGGLIPCPAAITVLLLCLQLKQFTLGFALVLCFSIGLAITLVAVGAAAALSVRHAAKRFSWFSTLARRAPYFSSILIIGVGLYVAYHGFVGLQAMG